MFAQWTRPFHASKRRNSYLMSSKDTKFTAVFVLKMNHGFVLRHFKKNLSCSLHLLSIFSQKKIPRPKFNCSFATYFSFTFAFGTTVALTMPPPSIIKSQPMIKIVVLFLCPVIPAGKSRLIRHSFVESTSSVFVLLESMFGVKGDL